MTTNRTLGPVAPVPYEAQTTRIIDAKGNSIASGGNNRAIQGSTLTDTLEFIVRACNAHDELVAAVEYALSLLEDYPHSAKAPLYSALSKVNRL